jgi:hypothetical protein
LSTYSGLNINGKQYWPYAVFYHKHKLVLAWHISENRTEQDFIWLFPKHGKQKKHKPEKTPDSFLKTLHYIFSV